MKHNVQLNFGSDDYIVVKLDCFETSLDLMREIVEDEGKFIGERCLGDLDLDDYGLSSARISSFYEA